MGDDLEVEYDVGDQFGFKLSDYHILQYKAPGMQILWNRKRAFRTPDAADGRILCEVRAQGILDRSGLLDFPKSKSAGIVHLVVGLLRMYQCHYRSVHLMFHKPGGGGT